MTELSLPEESIFAQALEIYSAAERVAYLERACGDNQALRAEVEALLRANERSGDLLDLPENPVANSDRPAGEGSGTVIGPYKLLEQIGEGGMGTVWMAEQTQPIQRRVAIKVVKEGMDSKQVLARFEAERQALALMDHPHIAKVLDAGKTPSGQPYFVMELVKGQPITNYCDENRLGVRARLDLFGAVCRALQHAHQKGIIHRDLKPSNVLVAPYDGKPVVKVIDFGVAKATGQRLTDKTLFTGIGSLVGTPEYMSPEQAEVNNQDIDTRSDIYSLGVLMYELLTGGTPLTRKRMKEAALLEVLRVIREEEPPRPSTRLSESKDSLPSISAQRQSEPAKLTKLVRGELDWIVMKSLEKDRNRRYKTADAFARDIERYLADDAVEACPPSMAYRLRKFVGRNKGTLLAATLLFLALVGGIIGTTWGMFRARHAQQAEAERAEGERQAKQEALAAALAEKKAKETAQDREAETKAVLDFLENKILAAARPKDKEGGLGYDVKLADALKSTLPFVDKRFADQPLIEARLRMTLGASFQYLGDYKTAADQYQAARAIYSKHRGPSHPDTLRSRDGLAGSFTELGRHADALKLNLETLQLSRVDLGPNHPGTLASMDLLASSYYYLGRYAEALKLYEEALRIRRATLGPDDPATLTSMNNLAFGYWGLGRYAEALKLREETFQLQKARLGPNHPDTLRSMNNLVESYSILGRNTEALKLNEEALPLTKASLGPNHPYTLSSMNNLAIIYESLGRSQEALKLHEETLALRKAQLGIDHPRTLESMINLANSYVGLGQKTEALKLREEALKLMRAKLPPDHPHTLLCMNNLAESYQSVGRYADALKLNEETLGKMKAKLGPGHLYTLTSMTNLAETYHDLGRDAEALKLGEEALQLKRAHLGADHPETFGGMNILAWILATTPDLKLRNPPRACELAKQAVASSNQDTDTSKYLGTYGIARYRTGDWKGAAESLEKSIRLSKPEDPTNANQGFVLAMAHWHLGDKEKSRQWFARSVQWMDKGRKDDPSLMRFRAEALELMGSKK
jgi:serine/threonine protein kinase/tetratricopeptide (TPR) repeat protein